MSAISLQGNASGTGTLTVAAPNTNTNRTLTLPDVTGTFLTSSGALVTSATGTVGYATGAGGAVTQLTSRTTGVTLNTPTGAITMFSALGSAVVATDNIVVNQKSGTNLYVLLVTAIAAGSFNITFYTTGGVATDAPVINFSVVKGVAA